MNQLEVKTKVFEAKQNKKKKQLHRAKFTKLASGWIIVWNRT